MLKVMAEAEEADVLVVGGGAVGLTMAAELSYRGIKAIVIEKNPTTSTLAKAVALNSRTMEHYRRLGLQEQIQEASYPRDLEINLLVSTNAVGGKKILRKHFASWGEISDGKSIRFPFYQPGSSVAVPMLCPQFTIEPILKEHLETSPHVKMYWGCKAMSLIQDESGVTVTAAQTATSSEAQEKVFRAKYVVACDGGSSWARKQLGIHTYGQFVIARACSITFRSSELFTRMKRDGNTGFSFIMNENIMAALILLSDKGEFALHISLPPTTPDQELENYVRNASQCVVDAMGVNVPHTIVIASHYNMHALISTKYRQGHCFLAGDSAHQWLPAGGLGMNTGISDAADLAWKLEAVLKGFGGPHLLDSYEIERRPLADATRRFALSFGSTVGFASASFARVRKIVVSNPVTRFLLSLLMGGQLEAQFTLGIDLVLGFQYSNSGIILHEYDSAGEIKLSATSREKFVPSSLPGCRAPHVTLPDCATILDLFGKQFVLLIIGGEETDLENLKMEMKNRGMPLESYSYPKLPELIACYDCKYFLIRPDGVVAWRSNTQPSSLEAKRIVATVVGDSPPQRITPHLAGEYCPPRFPRLLLATVISTSSTLLLHKYTNLSFASSLGLGMGIFWLLRGIQTRPKQEFKQQISRHRAVISNKFGASDEVLQIEPRFISNLHPNDVLIRVHAASINPIDIGMMRGYGAPLIKKHARLTRGRMFPLILGRDCSGEVVAIGDQVQTFCPGDLVYGAASWGRLGTHAEYVTMGEDELAFKPCNIDHKEAAGLPWVAVAVWTALVKHAGLNENNTRGKRVLVHGGTGGVGSFAVQLLKAWGAEVTTTCSSNNVNLAHRLGADLVIDYTKGDFALALKDYDIVFDTVGHAGGNYESRSLSVLKWFGGATYVSVRSPQLFLATKYGGFFGGLLFSWLYRFKIVTNRLFFGRAFYYSIAEPNGAALDVVRKMVEKGEIRPLIDAVYSMDEIVAAHKHVEGGHTRGKVIVTMT